jgi:hypothetical protein
MRRTAVPGDLVWVVARGDEHYGDTAVVYATSGEDPDGVVVRFDGEPSSHGVAVPPRGRRSCHT